MKGDKGCNHTISFQMQIASINLRPKKRVLVKKASTKK